MKFLNKSMLETIYSQISAISWNVVFSIIIPEIENLFELWETRIMRK